MPYRHYRIWRIMFVWPWAAASYMVLVAVILWQVVLWLTFDPRQPVHFERVEIMNSPIRPGEDLRARVWRRKVRDDCPVTAERTATNQDGVAFELGRPDPTPGKVGSPFIDVTYTTPGDLPDGLYTLRVRAVFECPRGLVFEMVQPLAPFRVQEHPDAVLAPALGLVPPALVSPEAISVP